MSNPITPIAASTQVSNYSNMVPLMASLRGSNDSMPKTGLPTEDPGTVQANTQLLPKVTIYTDHGKIAASKTPGKLLGYA